ncbi:hypothetical protein SAMN04490244_103134 [Tranquillimonas rosea]|uniref:Lipoprotein n=1 Tax=Tranquillimonas rosea TaxID=641238 RepID=A0A1H9SC33_9RHOB|nr:hypothetical protein [Tranquillimonas rosea]SER82580.1 hypothetical protein SAMN04490244_103134 [Tranquillimonas rosea]
MNRAVSYIVLSLGALAALAGCGTMSPEAAARLCEEQARRATGPFGQAAIGINQDGPVSGLEIGVTSDYIRGRDPMVVYEECVRSRSGQGPIRPPRLEP